MMRSRPCLSCDSPGANDVADVLEQGKFGAADADDGATILATVRSGKRHGAFTVDDAGNIGRLAVA
jgi:hypothetical protein